MMTPAALGEILLAVIDPAGFPLFPTIHEATLAAETALAALAPEINALRADLRTVCIATLERGEGGKAHDAARDSLLATLRADLHACAPALELALGALADINLADDLTEDGRRKKAGRIYQEINRSGVRDRPGVQEALKIQ